MRPSVEIKLSGDERSELEGLTNVQIGNVLGVTNQTARKWRNRFAEHRMDGLDDEPRSGRPRRIDDDAVAEVVRKTLEERPRDATQWSARSMARATGYAPSTIHRIWQAFSLQPHRSETFKLSADPYFVDKARDIVGLYVDRRAAMGGLPGVRDQGPGRIRHRLSVRRRHCRAHPPRSEA